MSDETFEFPFIEGDENTAYLPENMEGYVEEPIVPNNLETYLNKPPTEEQMQFINEHRKEFPYVHIKNSFEGKILMEKDSDGYMLHGNVFRINRMLFGWKVAGWANVDDYLFLDERLETPIWKEWNDITE